MRIGIEASNIRAGGGVNHLKNLLLFAEPEQYGIKKIIVCGRRNLLDMLYNLNMTDMGN